MYEEHSVTLDICTLKMTILCWNLTYWIYICEFDNIQTKNTSVFFIYFLNLSDVLSSQNVGKNYLFTSQWPFWQVSPLGEALISIDGSVSLYVSTSADLAL